MKSKIKLVHFISSLEMGGAQAVLYVLVSNLTKYEHSIIYIHDGPYKDRFEKLAIPMYPIAGFGPGGFMQLLQLLREIKPDCIHSSLWGANWLGRIAAAWLGIPCIAVLHNNSQLNGSVRHILDRFAPAACATVAVSQEVKNSFGYRTARIIHNGVQPHTDVLKTRQDLGLSDEHFVIGSVGRFHPDKQYDLLINSFAVVAANHDHARLVLFGAGAQEQYLRALAHSLLLEKKIFFIISQPAASYYALFDCFVLTSKNEGISMAMLEAMSNRVVPIMAYAEQTHPVITHAQNGLLVPHHAQSIADTIMQVMANSDLRIDIGDAAEKTVRNHFSAQQMIYAYDQLFNHVVTHRTIE